MEDKTKIIACEGVACRVDFAHTKSRLELFTHQQCFSRMQGLELLRETSLIFPSLLCREIDMIKEANRTECLGIKMSPTLVLDEKIISVGLPTKETLISKLKKYLKGEVYDVRD